jgi:predicted nucleic-acid-binding protein
MPKNIFVDLNVIVDVLLERTGFEASSRVIESGELGNAQLYISAHMVTTFAYLLEAAKVPRPEILRHIHWILNLFTVVATDNSLLTTALKSRVDDYENAVVEQAAHTCGAAMIITRNVRDFRASIVRAITPEEYLAQV